MGEFVLPSRPSLGSIVFWVTKRSSRVGELNSRQSFQASKTFNAFAWLLRKARRLQPPLKATRRRSRVPLRLCSPQAAALSTTSMTTTRIVRSVDMIGANDRC